MKYLLEKKFGHQLIYIYITYIFCAYLVGEESIILLKYLLKQGDVMPVTSRYQPMTPPG